MTEKTTKNFADVIRAELAADSELAKQVEIERLHADIAGQILWLRTNAKLSQKELAERVGTRQSVISRIEDADYYGHSLSMLERIAHVLKKRLVVIFCDWPSATTSTGKFIITAANTIAPLTKSAQERLNPLKGNPYIAETVIGNPCLWGSVARPGTALAIKGG